jgi:branched-chain amino acid transport system permease protein
MNELLQYVVTGLTVGSIYAIVALGFVTIYSVSKVINLAQGEFVMLGGMTMYTLTAAGIPYWVSFLLTIPLVMLIGVLLERLIIRPAKGADALSLIILTIGAAIFIRGLASIVWGKTPKKMEAFTSNDSIQVAGASITPQSIWVMAIMLTIVVGLYVLLEKTLIGKGLRACSSNTLAARLLGISPQKMSLFAFGFSAGIGAIAGMAIAPILYPSYDVGLMLGVKGFSAAIFGGLGSSPGAVVGGLTLGLVESLGAGYISSGLKDAIAFTIILVVLLVRPSGIMGEKSVGKGGL